MIQESQSNSPTFEEIYDQYFPVVRDYLRSRNGYCSLESLDDLSQEVFLRFWQQQKQLNGEPTFKIYR